MKAFLIFFTIGLVIGCCRDEVVAEYKFTDEEAAIIPFEEAESLQFVDSSGQTFEAQAEGKKSIIETERPGPDSCSVWEYETLTSSIYIKAFDIKLDIFMVHAIHSEEFTFRLQRGRQTFTLGCSETSVFSEDLFEDITVNGTEYKDVLALESCFYSNIDWIYYSRENGVEYIEFDDGSYLELIQGPQ